MIDTRMMLTASLLAVTIAIANISYGISFIDTPERPLVNKQHSFRVKDSDVITYKYYEVPILAVRNEDRDSRFKVSEEARPELKNYMKRYNLKLKPGVYTIGIFDNFKVLKKKLRFQKVDGSYFNKNVVENHKKKVIKAVKVIRLFY